MIHNIKSGMWATMLTPFTEDNKIDYPALDRLMQWYAQAGMDGLFALCYSSEVLRLSEEEKVNLMKFIIKNLPEGMGLVASGHGAGSPEEQIETIKRLRDTGLDVVVLVGNRLAAQEESEDILLDRVDAIMTAVPDVLFGAYECPYPFPRFFAPQTLRTLAGTNRFVFMKETSCDPALLEPKLEAVKGTPFKIYNANTATLLASLKMGAVGYCGIMANFHPDLYAELYAAYLRSDELLAKDLQALLSVFSVYERQCYPVNAKAYLRDEGLGFTTHSRLQDASVLTRSMMEEMEAMRYLTERARGLLKMPGGLQPPTAFKLH